MSNDIKQYLPHIYDGILEFEKLIASENSLFNTIDNETNKVKNNQYILTADIDGIIEYEKMLNIIPNPSTETVDFRRQRIVNRLSMLPPFTFRFLQQRLDEIIGVGKWEAKIDYNNYTLYIESSAVDQTWFQEILVTITKLKPANIVFINRPKIADFIKLNEQINLTQVNFNYRVGTTWVLGQKPFVSLEDMGVIKLATIPSIKPEMLNDIAAFTASDVAKVRINNNYIISNFTTKQSTNNLVTIEYELDESDGVNEVTKIELLDAENNVLTDSAVYIPILERVLLKHNILIKEGV